MALRGCWWCWRAQGIWARRDFHQNPCESRTTAPVFKLLFQGTIHRRDIPEYWRIAANLVPIYKKADKYKPGNYHPVFLTSVVCKLCEHIIYSNISKLLDHHKKLTDVQHVFWKQKSCDMHLILTFDDLAKFLDNQEQVDVMLLDIGRGSIRREMTTCRNAYQEYVQS